MEWYYWLLKTTAFLSPDYVTQRYNMASKKLLNWRHISLSLMDKIRTLASSGAGIQVQAEKDF